MGRRSQPSLCRQLCMGTRKTTDGRFHVPPLPEMSMSMSSNCRAGSLFNWQRTAEIVSSKYGRWIS